MNLLTGKELKEALLNSYACLSNEKGTIDALNVFPVPDGDTGTNMLLTYSSGVEAIKNLEEDNVGAIAKAFSRGLLMGARGNSGVILSQIFRGLSKSFEGSVSVNTEDFIKALVISRETAYKAVMNPVEGTILTVISDIAKDIHKYRNQEDFKVLMDLIVETGKTSLDNTPELLPVLKEAGVVDSGGYGLMVIIEGIRDYLYGNICETTENVKVFDNANVADESTEFGYCTEFIIELNDKKSVENKFSEEKLKQQLNNLGDSLVVVHDEDIVKVHVHTLVPGEALNIGQMYGEFLKLKIENMTVQHDELIKPSIEEKEKYAIVAVSPGNGIDKIFKDLSVNNIINGGQTMNPSTNDFVLAIEKLNAENIIILPNNSNIIMAATQAKEIIEESSDIKVEVIPTKSIIQAMVSLSFFNSNADLAENVEEMIGAYEDLNYGEVTYAVRDTVMNDVEIKSGEYIGIFDKKIVCSTTDKMESLFNLIDAMMNDDASVITLVCGKDIEADELAKVETALEEKYAGFDFEIYRGEQEVYSYFVGVE